MRYVLAAFALCAIAVTGCNRKSDYDAIFKDPILYSKTVYQLNTVVMGNNFSPIVASRNYTYANVAAYQVVAGGYPDQYESLAGQLQGLNPTPAPDKSKPDRCGICRTAGVLQTGRSRNLSGRQYAGLC